MMTAKALAILLLVSSAVLPAVSAAAQDASTPPADLEDLARREEAFRLRIIENPDAPDGFIGLARTQAAAGRSEQGIDLLLKAGERWIRSGAYDEAAAALAVAAELGPETARAFALLGRAQTLNRGHRSAAQNLRRAVDLGDTDPRTRIDLGSALWETGHPLEAEEIYRQALAPSGRSFLAVYQLGRLLLWQGRYGEAAPLLREAAGRGPATEVLLDLAEALRGAGEIEEAIAVYRRVLELAPDLTKAHYGLGLVLKANGDPEGARRELELFQRLFEGDEERGRLAERQKGEVDRGLNMIAAGELEAAIAHLSALPETPDSLAALAGGQARAGRHEMAATALERAVVLDPSRSDLRRRLGEERRAVAAEEDGGGS